jgi:hypothetical protein
MAINPYSHQTSKGRPSEEPVITVVAYKKDKKTFISTFPNMVIDDILDSSRRKPLIPNEYEIIDVGVGKSFIERYMKQYEVTKINAI